ncbi:MAG TPA: GrpB family protein [Mycobacteriales bacterium]|nr:GrpB family protein [Mycobacteriales bacterium]
MAEPLRSGRAAPQAQPARSLAERLAAAGVSAGDDPFATWTALRAVEGRRTTVVDLYRLAAAPLGILPQELPQDRRADLAARAMRVIWPGFEVTTGGERDTDPVSIVDYDPAWPRQFAEWRSRISAELGASAVRIDHVGSTAVPGLTAKPTIDVQVSVAALDDEPAYAAGLERIGLVLRSRDRLHRFFRPPPGQPRSVHVHVCAAGGAWEREHLLFRDHLRTHPLARREYAAAKREAVETWGSDRVAYGEAKSDVILDQLSDAEGWAAQVGWAPGHGDTGAN